jgi:hypothetical protein
MGIVYSFIVVVVERLIFGTYKESLFFELGVCLAVFISVVVQSFQSDKHPTEAL